MLHLEIFRNGRDRSGENQQEHVVNGMTEIQQQASWKFVHRAIKNYDRTPVRRLQVCKQ